MVVGFVIHYQKINMQYPCCVTPPDMALITQPNVLALNKYKNTLPFL
ncbi:hypothetical protein D088_090005 [Salmonella enterica subsp. houtenae serovar 16:z4,z32:-- str. RKS3027]|nr:hypothetical protein D088_090005 [Salmonella enterica subsp. houtenae serovar 16:z4,z32:-- str. RKS3027]